MNIDKQVGYWLNSAKDDWEAANHLLDGGKYRHALFFVHLAIEKTLKAIYSKRFSKVPPKIHNLDRMAELCGLSLSEEHEKIISIVNAFNIEGRYPETLPVNIDKKEAGEVMRNGEGVYQWLIKQL